MIGLRLYSTTLDSKGKDAQKLSLISRKTFGHKDFLRPKDIVLLSKNNETVVIADIAQTEGLAMTTEIAGFAIYNRNKSTLVLSCLAVDYRFRNLGVGSALIERVKRRVSNPDADVTKISTFFDDSILGVSDWFINRHGFWAAKNSGHMPAHITHLEFDYAAVRKDDHGIGSR